MKHMKFAGELLPLLVDEGLTQGEAAQRLGIRYQTMHGRLRLIVASYQARTLEQACVLWDRERRQYGSDGQEGS